MLWASAPSHRLRAGLNIKGTTSCGATVLRAGCVHRFACLALLPVSIAPSHRVLRAVRKDQGKAVSTSIYSSLFTGRLTLDSDLKLTYECALHKLCRLCPSQGKWDDYSHAPKLRKRLREITLPGLQAGSRASRLAWTSSSS